MKRSTLAKIACLALALWGPEAVRAAGPGALQQIKANYRQILVPPRDRPDSLLRDLLQIPPETEFSDQMVAELHQRYPFDPAKIRNLLSTLRAEGSWPDINYADTKRSGWEPKQHAERILELTKLYCSDDPEFGRSDALREAIHRALGFWFRAGLRCKNWWYNEIGIPKTLGAAFVLLEEQLSDEERAAAVGVMEQSKFGMTGQNKVWLAGNVLIRGLLENDTTLVRAARDTIASEIVLGRREGIQEDWSFHQHGPQQQFGNYGLSYVSGMSFFARLFRGTSCAFDDGQQAILRRLVDNGYRWIIWNRYMDISSLGRQLFHHAQVHKAYALAFAAADLGMTGFPKQGNPLVGHKHFGDSDYTVHRAPTWMASVKMSSARVTGSELVNEDNLKGYYLGDGATYYYVRGDEYLDVFPFWDWRKIPGVTAYGEQEPMPDLHTVPSNNRSALVGGLSDGRIGLTAMQLDRNGLNACKAWFFTDTFVLCLGAGIRSDRPEEVTTSVDQRLKQGELTVWEPAGWRTVTGRERFDGAGTRLFHDRTGYIVAGGAPLAAAAERRTGRWCDFMKMYRPATVEGEVVSLHLQHGVQPDGGSYTYIVLPDSSPEQTAAFDPAQEVRVVRNDAAVQAVQLPSDAQRYWVAAYAAGTVDLDGVRFSPGQPGVYCVERSAAGAKAVLAAPFRTGTAD